MKTRNFVLMGLALLLGLGTLAWLAIAAFHFWESSGPPIPQPRDVFATRGWIDLGVALVLAVCTGGALWARK
jgi:heme A synthase